MTLVNLTFAHASLTLLEELFHMKTSICLFMLLFVSVPTPVSADDAAFAKWEKDIAAIEAKIKSGESPQGSILFVGSSSIRLWNLKESFPAIVTSNHGFGGSQLADSVHFFERIVAPVKPSVIVLSMSERLCRLYRRPSIWMSACAVCGPGQTVMAGRCVMAGR